MTVNVAAPAGWRVYPVWGLADDGACRCPKGRGCPHPGKHPTPPGGFNDASSDPLEIARLFARWPGDNVGLKTGRGSGVAALDSDGWGGGGQSLEVLQELQGPLPPTRLHESGSGALHLLYSYPEGLERLPSRTIAPGVELKADGAGLVLPPSRHWTGGYYEVLIDRELAPLPDWIVRLATALTVIEGGGDGQGARSRYALPERMHESSPGRDRELFRYACSMRAHGWEHGAMLGELRRVNVERCVPPMRDDEVRKLAASAARYAPGSTSTATPEVLRTLDAIEAALWDRPWPGVGGKSERSVVTALVLAARRHGALILAGVRISLDFRSLALNAGMRVSSAHRAVQRLRRKGWLRYDNEGRRPGESGAFVLLARATEHSTTPSSPLKKSGNAEETKLVSVPPRAPRLRWGGSLGKTCEAVVDALERAGGELTLKEAADAVGVKRQRDLRRRHVTRLEVAGVVTCSADAIRLTAGWLEALERERTLSGEKRVENMERAQYELDREAYRMHLAETGEARRETHRH